MKIAVAHHSLNIPGGAEKLCITAVEALLKKGHDVSLVTVEKTDWRIVRRNFGAISLPTKEAYATKSRFSRNLSNVPVAATYFLGFAKQILSAESSGKYDVVVNTFGDVLSSIADITYVHFPLRASVQFDQIPAFSNKSMWRAISPLYDVAAKALDKVHSGILLTNSKFMQGIIRKALMRESLVVYPPVDVSTFSPRYYEDRKAGSTVAVVASYTPKRHLEQVPMIAKYSKHAKFVVMGKADEYSPPILTRLKTMISDLHVEDRVILRTNVPFDELAETLSKTKVYLHVMPSDHFGISVVESMASGCVPVVHRSGGPWLDILDDRQGEYGFSYATSREAAEFIDALLTDEGLRSQIASRALNRAMRFDRSVFENRIVEIIERAVN